MYTFSMPSVGSEKIERTILELHEKFLLYSPPPHSVCCVLQILNLIETQSSFGAERALYTFCNENLSQASQSPSRDSTPGSFDYDDL